MTRPTIIVLVPVRNEAWILKTFLECTSLWADHILIADQSSDDGSRELAASFPKVKVIDNPDTDYNEVVRQRLLIREARLFPSPRFLIALDADEILSATVLDSPEWETALRLPPGTVVHLPKVELYHSPDQYYLHSVEDKRSWIPFAFVDDGAEHEGTVIHTCRIPEREQSPRFKLNEVVVLHFNRINKWRSESRDRWYRCFERVSFPEKNIQSIHGVYDFFERLQQRFKIRPTLREWFTAYRQAGVDFDFDASQTVFWWDFDVLRMFNEHGTGPFRYLDIWSFDWEALRLEGQSRNVPGLPSWPIDVPRRARDRLIRAALRWPHGRKLVNRITWRLFHYGIINTRFRSINE